MTGTLLRRGGTLVSTFGTFVSSVQFVQRRDVCGGGVVSRMCPAQDFERLGDPFRPLLGRPVHLAWRGTRKLRSAHPVGFDASDEQPPKLRPLACRSRSQSKSKRKGSMKNKKRPTFAKRARELKLLERRALKQEKKQAAAAARSADRPAGTSPPTVA
jgi:hypothetical protein